MAACAPGVSVAKLALEHGVNTNLLFKWRREYRAGKFGAPIAAHTLTGAVETPALGMPTDGSSIQLLPVVEVAATAVGNDRTVRSEPACIEILFGYATVRICGTPEIAPLRAVLDCLARRR